MKTREEDQQLDHYFRERLSADHTSEMEADWALLKERLRREKKKRSILPYLLSGIAALLLLFLSLFLFNNQTVTKNDTYSKSTKAGQTVTSTGADTSTNTEVTRNSRSTDQAPTGRQLIDDGNRPYRDVPAVFRPAPVRQEAQYGTTLTAPNPIVPVPASPVVQQPPPQAAQQPASQAIAQAPAPVSEQEQPGAGEPSKSNRQQRNKGLTLAFSLAPDVSAVNTFSNGKIGLAAGAGISLKLKDRLSVSAGVNYAQKVYSTPFSNYKPVSSYQFPVKPLNVDANCSVLDIPVGISYTMMDRENDRLSIGTGLSSYIMLNEKYNFTYSNPYARAPRRYRVDNENQHIMGVVNINASYERKLPNGTRLGINPYMQLPLTNIGYGNVRLKSAGVALSLSVDLSKKQPKE